MTGLPGQPGPKLTALWSELSEPERQALLAHLRDDTSTNWISKTLARFGKPIAPSTLRDYRATIRLEAAA